MGNWRKSTYSNGTGGSCVEVADAPGAVPGGAPGGILVRDTKQEGRPDRTVVRFPPAAWTRFTTSLR